MVQVLWKKTDRLSRGSRQIGVRSWHIPDMAQRLT
jgi:hypothetical protein